MSTQAPNEARVIPLRPHAAPPGPGRSGHTPPAPAPREPLWRDLVGDALRRERLAQERTLKDVAETARISMPYLSELERGRKEASSEVLAAAAKALGLGLGDLLSLAQEELVRHSLGRTAQGRTSSPSSARSNGLCLAA
ncbi:helix-turn-helix transcriptional regulator [Kitasatospora sp. NPDC096077]|uniref:helix-turn-helix domain-containing protein n=1 Tax=Kitasatospora sp. NPDC096077 TaxID=3155544 RepID=UPI003319564D